MTPDAYLHELTDKHRVLEHEIETESARPLANTLKIAQLKKEKLRIKDEITKRQAVEIQVA